MMDGEILSADFADWLRGAFDWVEILGLCGELLKR
jgi:hypothetical protein